ncbi:MAG: hypothetical protein ACRCVN_03965 [Spirochaetia bacterium]
MSNKKSEKPASLVEKIFRIFSGGNKESDSEKQNKRLLKGLAELLKKRAKYYDFPNHRLQPAVARFFYDIYLIVGPIKPFTQNLSRSEQVRSIVVETFLPELEKEFCTEIFTESIYHRFDSLGLQQVRETMKEKTEQVYTYLNDRTLANRINIAYAYLCCFAGFCSFDFYSILKKFDSSLPVANFEYKLTPEPVPASQILDELEDFLVEAIPLLSIGDWDEIFDILKNYRNTEIVNRHGWQKMLSSINEMVSSQTFESIVKFVRNDPTMAIKATITTVDIVKPYIKKITNQVKTVVQKVELIERKKVNEKVGRDLFMGADYGSALRHYTKGQSGQIFGEGADGYEYADILSALVHFSNIYLDRDIKKLMDRLILVGNWSQTSHYKDFSNALQDLLQNRVEILEFDKTLTEESGHVIRLKNLVKSPGKDRTSLNNLRTEINVKAMSLMRNANQGYAILAKSLKTYLDDYKKKPGSELVLNWDDVARDFERPLGRYMADIYTKIYQLLQMMQQYL